MPNMHEPYAVVGGSVLKDTGEIELATVVIAEGEIVAVTEEQALPRDFHVINGHGSCVLPGIVDVHGDSFERQIMPRPGVAIDAGMALLDTDRQLVSNGITTAFHGVTYSWEPGLRGRDTLLSINQAMNNLKPRLKVDTRLHMRFETFNTEGVNEVAEWLMSGKIDILAFNEHTAGMIKHRGNAKKVQRILDRTGLDKIEYMTLLDHVYERAPDTAVPVEKLAQIALAANVPMFSHDDNSPSIRKHYHQLGCLTSEFPLDALTASTAADLGNDVVVGAPNIVRGGSHVGLVSASELISQGVATIIASDYYYPALFYAPFALVRAGLLDLPSAWMLVSVNPARATGLADRGSIAEKMRADLLIVDQIESTCPRLKMVISNGHPLVFH